MKTRRRWIFAGLLGALFLYGWHYWLRLPFVPAQPLEAVSGNTAIFAEYADGRRLYQADTLLSADALFSQLLTNQNFSTDFQLLRQILSQAALPQAFRVVLGLQNTTQGNITPLLIADAHLSEAQLQTLIAAQQPRRTLPSHFQGHTVYRLLLPDGREVALARFRNLLLLARYPFIIEDMLQRLHKPYASVSRKVAFRIAQRPKGEAHLRMFVNAAAMPDLLAGLLRAEGQQQIHRWGKTAQWLRLEVHPKPTLLQINGAMTTTTGDHLWRGLAGQRPQTFGAILRVIPDQIAYLHWMSCTDAQQLLHAPNQNRNVRFDRYILPWVTDEVALVRNASAQFLVLRCRDTDIANKALTQLAEQAGLLRDYRYQAFTIRQIMDDQLLRVLPGAPEFSNPVFTIIENYVIFASSRSALEVWLDEYTVSKTLSHNETFLRLYQPVRQEALHAFVYANMENAASRIQNWLANDTFLQPGQPEQLGQFVLAFRRHSSAWRYRGYWAPATIVADQRQVGTAWKTFLDADAITPPMLIPSQNGEPAGIVIQDSLFNLYYIRPDSEIAWKKKLDGPILSNVHLIDYYPKTDGQLLFNTPHQIHLLDRRRGDQQGAFPLRLQTPATNGVSVVDFNNNGDYSFFVACANGNLYGFDKQGRPLPGWNPLSGAGTVRHAIQHWQHANKDFLAALNAQGRLQVFRRDGTPRFAAVQVGECTTPPEVQLSGKDSRIVTLNRQGVATIINMDGGSGSRRLLPATGQAAHFAYADVIGDERKDFLAVSGEQLSIHYYEGTQFKEWLRLKFEAPLSHIQVLTGKAEPIIGVVSSAKKQVYLLHLDGELHRNGLLAGHSAFFVADLMGNGQQLLVVANGSSVYAYKITL